MQKLDLSLAWRHTWTAKITFLAAGHSMAIKVSKKQIQIFLQGSVVRVDSRNNKQGGMKGLQLAHQGPNTSSDLA